MKMLSVTIGCVLILLQIGSAAAQFDKLLQGVPGLPAGVSSTPQRDDSRLASGLKEALQIGTDNTVKLTGKPGGYLTNDAIKILLPARVRSLEPGLRAAGFGPQVDELVVSMNRAAERSAPAAKEIFLNALTSMTFDDATKILKGGNTAATEYFKRTTTESLTSAFRPVVDKSMNEVGVARQYHALLGKAPSLPFINTDSMDIDSYVVGKALDGLFHVLGEQERAIRTNPAARVTDLLKETFGK